MKPFNLISDPAVIAINMGMSGKDADASTKLYGSVLVKKQPFIAIQLPDLMYLKKLVEHADLAGYYYFEGSYNLSAFYKHDEYFPIARSYYIKLGSKPDCEVVSQNLNQKGKPLKELDDISIFMFTEHAGHEKRVDDFFERIRNKSECFQGLFDGRKKHTTTDSAMYFDSSGCLACGQKNEELFSTSIIGDKGILFGFNLCRSHADECREANSNLEYLSSIFGVAPPFRKEILSRNKVIEMVSDMLISEFDCRIDNISADTITAYRIDSDFKLVFRLTSEMNYGYMIFPPDCEDDVARFDSANHHAVDYGPDHLHRDLKNKKEKPVSSFLTGFPILDKVALKSVIEEKEQEHANQ